MPTYQPRETSEDDLRKEYNHKRWIIELDTAGVATCTLPNPSIRLLTGSGGIAVVAYRNFTGMSSSQMSSIKKEVLQLWQKLSAVDPTDTEHIQRSIVKHATSTLARTVFNMDSFATYQAAAHSVRDRLIESWNVTQQHHTLKDPKRVYYLSLEFLLGRSLDNALLNLGLKPSYTNALGALGFNMEDIIHEEDDAALGNGGLGRLAACYMDSLACLEYAAWGYGIRYTYGIFKQKIIEGNQTEFPDYWLNFGNPWEVPRLDVIYEVRFYGQTVKYTDLDGAIRWKWEGGEKVQAVAYDVPIPGFKNNTCLNIRLWSSKPMKRFDLTSFNEGAYEKSVSELQKAENITSVLYPNDNHSVGKELRLKQEYFFVCATLKDIIRRFKKTNRPWSEFPDQVAIQLNDTHPTLGVVELQRRLIDIENLEWHEAWDIVTRTYTFTNHTVLPEALETWPVSMVTNLLPRHMQIIFEINMFFLQKVEARFPQDRDRLRRMSIIEEGTPQRVRMAHLAVVGSHTVNGVAELHSQLVRDVLFKDFAELYGAEKFLNVTNGITPRRWLNQANPTLATLITSKIGDGWHKDLTKLAELKKYADNAEFRKQWMTVKLQNKQRLANYVDSHCGIKISPTSLFDVQVKRIHEYKRQLMNILGVIHRYNVLSKLTPEQRIKEIPRVVIFGGKAAPGYYIAKLIIKLISSVADVVNNNRTIGDSLKVIFIPDYNVSVAEIIVPSSDISQHISTAGTEASGTSNMKFVLNGGLIVGTVDGANIEIRNEVGTDNIFMFGALAHEVEDIRHAQRYRKIGMDKDFAAVLDSINANTFGEGKAFAPLLDTLTHGGDFYLLSQDFATYLDALKCADEEYRKQDSWAKKTILATASMSYFSSDRAVETYAKKIWHMKPCPVPPNV